MEVRALADILDVGDLTREAIQNILKVHHNGEPVEVVEIGGMEERGGRAANDNYNSQMKQLEVTYRVKGDEKKLHLLLKVPPSSFLATIHKLVKPVTRESMWYSQWVKELAKVEPDISKMSVVCYLANSNYLHQEPSCCVNNCSWICWCPCQAKERGVIMMENLSKRETSPLQLLDKCKVPSLDQVKVIMRSLATFHGSWWLYLNMLKDGQIENPPGTYKEVLNDLILPMPEAMVNSMMAGHVDMLEKLVEKEEEEVAVKWLKKYKRKVKSRLSNLYPPPHCKFITVVHGDFWSNNLMVRLDSDKVIQEMKMIDMANYNLSHPVIDITYFLYVSTDREFRRNHLDSVLEEYFATLRPYLDRRNEDYSYGEFKKDFDSIKDYGLVFGTMVMANVLSPVEMEINSMRDMMNMTKNKKKVLLNRTEDEHGMITEIRKRCVETVLEFANDPNFQLIAN